MMGGFEWGMGPGGWLWMVFAIVLVIAVAWALFVAIAGRSRSTDRDAADILKTRFARGEISHEEYEQARRLLGI